LDEEKAGLDQLDSAVRRLEDDKAGREDLQRLLGDIARQQEEIARMGAALADTTGGLHGFAVETRGGSQEMRTSILNLQSQLARLLSDVESGRRGKPRAAAAVKSVQDIRDRLFDDFYAQFENRFRGSRDEILRRVEEYLPIVRRCGVVGPEMPVIDIGCGRGEWLEVLRGQGIPAYGIDISGVFVAECRQRGLDAVEAEALTHLRERQDGSVGMVTAMHVVEHLAFRDLIVLLDEAFRVLVPGGVLILETPNPENLIVGACNFWFDPTHIRPLPPDVLHFAVQARGFDSAEILRLHPYPEDSHLPESEMSGQLNNLLYGPRDYSVVAAKPGNGAMSPSASAR
jgi:O-antigen chain-terminating methyltransferase